MGKTFSKGLLRINLAVKPSVNHESQTYPWLSTDTQTNRSDYDRRSLASIHRAASPCVSQRDNYLRSIHASPSLNRSPVSIRNAIPERSSVVIKSSSSTPVCRSSSLPVGPATLRRFSSRNLRSSSRVMVEADGGDMKLANFDLDNHNSLPPSGSFSAIHQPSRAGGSRAGAGDAMTPLSNSPEEVLDFATGIASWEGDTLSLRLEGELPALDSAVWFSDTTTHSFVTTASFQGENFLDLNVKSYMVTPWLQPRDNEMDKMAPFNISLKLQNSLYHRTAAKHQSQRQDVAKNKPIRFAVSCSWVTSTKMSLFLDGQVPAASPSSYNHRHMYRANCQDSALTCDTYWRRGALKLSIKDELPWLPPRFVDEHQPLRIRILLRYDAALLRDPPSLLSQPHLTTVEAEDLTRKH